MSRNELAGALRDDGDEPPIPDNEPSRFRKLFWDELNSHGFCWLTSFKGTRGRTREGSEQWAEERNGRKREKKKIAAITTDETVM
ncbi:hypothetical protein EYF80_024570 [Liparis tanakae]|uniref:Uncharacterized protein n=1 Tax=Liparis tanakae TaxID=230148 RepID=A0A4Z2HJQ5_9TELE|nr:hypothetical protein EYF80_024570 [Liparis tanakae]